MLVPAMTWEEIRDEMLTDWDEVNRKALIRLKAASDAMFRKKQKGIHEVFKIPTKNKNEWDVSVNITVKGGVRINHYIRVFDNVGAGAYSILTIEDQPVLVKYNCHFFKRYRERMHHEIIKPEHLIMHFFRHNSEQDARMTKEVINEVHCITLPFDNGLALGVYHPVRKLIHLKTFVSPDLYTEDQQKMFELLASEDKESDEMEMHIKDIHFKNDF